MPIASCTYLRALRLERRFDLRLATKVLVVVLKDASEELRGELAYLNKQVVALGCLLLSLS